MLVDGEVTVLDRGRLEIEMVEVRLEFGGDEDSGGLERRIKRVE